jgi:RHS repeat-associated protein
MGWQLAHATTFTKQKLSFSTLNIKEAGYLFVYLSYDDDSNNYVYFDDFKITHTKTNVIQYNEYYPFGLQNAASWTRENSKGNNFLYNEGSELNATSGLYETAFRNYDPSLGRFIQIDALAHQATSQSVYSYASNNPVLFNDPTGLMTENQLFALYSDMIRDTPNGGFSSWSETAGYHYFDSNGNETGGSGSTYMGGEGGHLSIGRNANGGMSITYYTMVNVHREIIGTGNQDNIAFATFVDIHTVDLETQQSRLNSSLDYMDYLGYGSSGLDLLVSAAQFTVGAIKNSGQHKAAYETSKFLKNSLNFKVRPGDLRKGTKQFLGNASKKVAVIGAVLAVGDVLID